MGIVVGGALPNADEGVPHGGSGVPRVAEHPMGNPKQNRAP